MTQEVFKTRYAATDRSVYNSEYTLAEVIDAKIAYLLERAKTEFILPITKEQLAKSTKPFADLPANDFRRVPLIGYHYTEAKHIAGRAPTKREAREMVARYGLTIDWPHFSLLDLAQSRIRKTVNKFRKEPENSPVYAIPFRKYFDENGNIKESEENEFSNSYQRGFLFLNLHQKEAIQAKLDDDNTPLWLVHQFAEAKAFTLDLINRKEESLEQQMLNTQEEKLFLFNALGSLSAYSYNAGERLLV